MYDHHTHSVPIASPVLASPLSVPLCGESSIFGGDRCQAGYQCDGWDTSLILLFWSIFGYRESVGDCCICHCHVCSGTESPQDSVSAQEKILSRAALCYPELFPCGSRCGSAPKPSNPIRPKSSQNKENPQNSCGSRDFLWWRLLDSNQWPHACEAKGKYFVS